MSLSLPNVRRIGRERCRDEVQGSLPLADRQSVFEKQYALLADTLSPSLSSLAGHDDLRRMIRAFC